ncbi:hypothetical protein RJ640_000865 [Escallonia rubra]|uniref:SET domain-containing protein n=2 Tax=Escallonia rubra TaxID=112253 RepID=A0AA88U4X0_9ASTE|nr:hypothetical protein RJ640_000865 [Escallonia rubra]
MEEEEEEEEEEANLKSFLEWAAAVGISDSQSSDQSEKSTRPPSSLGQRGLAAVRDLRKGELILKVPKHALMTSESLMEDRALSAAVRNYPSLSPTQILNVALLREAAKGKSSLWFPYLKQLPRRYDTLASFGQFETQALQVDDAIWTAERAVGRAELEWRSAIAIMGELELKPHFRSFKAWLWASATISSRTLHVPWDDAGCLCPVGDFFNYSAPGEEQFESEVLRSASSLCRSWDATEESDAEDISANLLRLTDGGYEEEVGAYCFYANRNYRKEEQVLLSYGTYTNLELLEHYGFLLDENPNDKAFIALVPDIYSSCSWPKDSLYIQQSGKPSFAMLCAMRLWATPMNQRKSFGHLAYSGSQLSTANETSVMQWIAKNCHLILENLSTTIEEDFSLLQTIDKMHECHAPMELELGQSTIRGQVHAFLETNGLLNGGVVALHWSGRTRGSVDRWKLAVQWRLKYKQILLHCISYCNGRIRQFTSQDDSTNRSIRPQFEPFG